MRGAAVAASVGECVGAKGAKMMDLNLSSTL